MTTEELIKVLKTLPKGSFDVIVKGRASDERIPIICASIPDGSVPTGWRAASEPSFQHIPGFRRVRYDKT
jgi:hypothetical protein